MCLLCFPGIFMPLATQKPNEIINFPNLSNSNNTYLLCRIANGKMEVDYVGLTDKDKKHFTFPIK